MRMIGLPDFLSVVFDNYTAPGEYTDANGDLIVTNYTPVEPMSAVVDMTAVVNIAGLFPEKNKIKLFASLGNDSNPEHTIYSGVYVLSDKPIYIINAGGGDVQQMILQMFPLSANEKFVSVFNNFNTDYAM